MNKRMREIQLIADHVRENCKVIKYAIADLFDECERLGYLLVRYPAGEKGVLGFAQIRDDDKVIFTNSSARLAREIFSVAHEIGHMQLHINEDTSLFTDDHSTFSGTNSNAFEIEANYFAACLLMPAGEVAKYIDLVMDNKPVESWTAFDIAKMMSAFSVSFEMTLNRLNYLGVINPKDKRRLDSEKEKKKVTNLLRIIGGNSCLNLPTEEKEVPSKYIEWVIHNYNDGIIPEVTLKKALSYFDITIEDIRDELHPPLEKIDEDLDELIGGIS